MSSILEQLSDVIGQEAAYRLCRSMGGISYYIPKAPRPDHRIAERIGQGAWEKLCAYYGGTRLKLPTGEQYFKRQRAVALLQEGRLSNRQIALEIGGTEGFVSQLRAQLHRASDAVLPLFDQTGPGH